MTNYSVDVFLVDKTNLLLNHLMTKSVQLNNVTPATWQVFSSSLIHYSANKQALWGVLWLDLNATVNLNCTVLQKKQCI